MAKPHYEFVATRILADLEKGVAPWIKPWDDTGMSLAVPYSAVRKKNYRGMNTIYLWIRQMEKGYKSPAWLTMKDANSLGGKVKKGEQATWVIFWKPIPKKDDPNTNIWLLRAYMVYNVDQCEGLPEGYGQRTAVTKPESAFWERVEALKVNLQHGDTRAYYDPNQDYVMLPMPERFKTPHDYLSTAMHEVVHWSGHETRMDRELSTLDPDKYAFEELVAELGSAFLCAEFGVPLTQLQHSNYIGHWIKRLRDDPRAIMTAASKAQKAVDFILGNNHGKTQDE